MKLASMVHQGPLGLPIGLGRSLLTGKWNVNRTKVDVFVWTDRSMPQVLADGVPNNYPFLVAYFDPVLRPQAGGTLLKVHVDASSGIMVNKDLDKPRLYGSADRMLLPVSWLRRNVAAVTHAYELDHAGAIKRDAEGQVTGGYQVVGPGGGAGVVADAGRRRHPWCDRPAGAGCRAVHGQGPAGCIFAGA